MPAPRLGHKVNISIHALREEGDPVANGNARGDFLFLSTPSVRRATVAVVKGNLGFYISIHALREEGDLLPARHHRAATDFYPRPP